MTHVEEIAHLHSACARCTFPLVVFPFHRVPGVANVRILSIDGGGYLGLATASFLHAVEKRFGTRSVDRFDLFCGTSTGAIIALALASGKSGEDVATLYRRLGPEVFRRPPLHERLFPKLRLVRAMIGALHGNQPLRAALVDAFGDLTLGNLREQQKKVLVTAFCVTSGRPVIFKTDHAAGLVAHDRHLVRDIAMASSAAPSFLPLVEVADPTTGAIERYCDGAMVSNSPALLGYAEAVSHLNVSPGDIEILSLGTPRADLAERASALTWSQRKLSRGLLGWRLGQRIITLAIDGGSMVTDTALKRITQASGARYVRVALSQPEGLGLDIASPEATETLYQLGVDRARDAALQEQLAAFFVN